MPGTPWVPLPGQVVRAEVQYSDSEETKSRFPVVVSSDRFNESHPDVIVAFSTKSANVRHPRDYDVEVSDRHPSFRSTGLRLSTTVRCGRLWSLDKDKISDVVGVVPKDILDDILRLVRSCFDE